MASLVCEYILAKLFLADVSLFPTDYNRALFTDDFLDWQFRVTTSDFKWGFRGQQEFGGCLSSKDLRLALKCLWVHLTIALSTYLFPLLKSI